MKKRFMAGLVASAALAMFAVPMAGHSASLVPHVVEADCTGTTDASGAGTCTASFNFTQGGFVSNIDTHGNFHTLAQLPPGSVTLEWKDSAGTSIYKVNCVAPGLYLDPAGTGPFDIQSFTCSGGTTQAQAVEGAQTLTVTASGGPAATVFHGHLSISAEGALI